MTPERLATFGLALAALLAVLLLIVVARASRLARENRQLRMKLADVAAGAAGGAGGAWPSAAVLPSAREAPAGAPVLPPDAQARVQRLLIEGRTIDAIKAYRESTGLGLKESKDAIDALRRTLGV